MYQNLFQKNLFSQYPSEIIFIIDTKLNNFE